MTRLYLLRVDLLGEGDRRLFFDSMHYAESNDIPGLLMNINFEKKSFCYRIVEIYSENIMLF